LLTIFDAGSPVFHGESASMHSSHGEPARHQAPAHQATVAGAVYQALVEDLPDDGSSIPPGTVSTVWRAIDLLQEQGADEAQIKVLEQVSIELHVLRLAHAFGDEESRLRPRTRIAALAEDWLEVARIGGC
jgi:hypothetical protein